MTQPIQTLFDSTSRQAGEAAIRSIPSRQAKIMALLRERGAMTIFEIAAELGVYDHQISGRFSELEREGQIQKTGKRRTKPDTACEGELYEVTRRGEALMDCPDPMVRFGFPSELKLKDGAGPGGQSVFERQPPLSPHDAPGVPYVRRGGPGYIRLTVRVMLITCDGCGKPLRLVEKDGVKSYRCGSDGCPEWRLEMAQEPGRSPLLALVAHTH